MAGGLGKKLGRVPTPRVPLPKGGKITPSMSRTRPGAAKVRKPKY